MSSKPTFLGDDPESRARALDNARRIEVFALVVISALIAVQYYPFGVVLAAPFLVMAAVLVPRERDFSALTWEQKRMDLLSRLQTEARHLRGAYMHAWAQPLSLQRSQRMWEARREITVWLDRSRRQMRRFPEIAGIYEAHTTDCGLVYELDECLSRLGQISRLCGLSRKLGLPL